MGNFFVEVLILLKKFKCSIFTPPFPSLCFFIKNIKEPNSGWASMVFLLIVKMTTMNPKKILEN